MVYHIKEKLSQGKSALLYSVSILVVFLCLAALYESWKVPLSVILVIPLGVIGAVFECLLPWIKENDVLFPSCFTYNNRFGC